MNLFLSERRFEFFVKWGRGLKPANIFINVDGYIIKNPEWDKDVIRRDAFMDRKDKYRRDGRRSRIFLPDFADTVLQS